VYTFNAARNRFSTMGTSSRQINVVVPGDNVGDVETNTSNPISGLPGFGCLPGRELMVNSVDDQSGGRFFGDIPGSVSGLLGSHSLNGLIGGLADAAR
jgi:hypothetical protein